MNITPLEAAKLYIDAAADAGVDCVKFQSYKADTIASKIHLRIGTLQKNPQRRSTNCF